MKRFDLVQEMLSQTESYQKKTPHCTRLYTVVFGYRINHDGSIPRVKHILIGRKIEIRGKNSMIFRYSFTLYDMPLAYMDLNLHSCPGTDMCA